MACPFGFSGAPRAEDGGCDGDVSECDDVKGGPLTPGKLQAAAAAAAGCPAAGVAAGAPGNDRFDYNKDPVSWFFQNQIRSEEEFQERKAELRTAALARLDDIFERKGKRLVVDSDDDAFSICSSELSAWDSDVASIGGLAAAAAEWREEAHIQAPAEALLQVALAATMVAAGHCSWTSLQALTAVNRYWGILNHGWVPLASFVTSVAMAATAACCWLLMGRTRKRTMLGLQVALQLLYVVAAALALASLTFPAEINADLKESACTPRQGSDPSGSKLCQYLPAIEDEVRNHVAAIMTGCAAQAVACVAALALSSWYLWELGFVEKKAAKIKRRNRHRKNRIPWEKIKVENMGPVTSCGGGGAAAGRGGKAAVPTGGAATGSGGGCPFSKMAGAAGGAGQVAGDKKIN
ncbi:MAG: hypothetical protein J3K34DRAFT_226379 [Monoraphidium minutum]|nr:MAG: hypothetical protein J3K34DRAFT_226379 [Monoraphidium minutum]